MGNRPSRRHFALACFGGALLVGALFWVVDAVLDYLFFHQNLRFLLLEGPQTIWESLFTRMTLDDLVDRIVFIATSLVMGGLTFTFLSRQEKARRALAESEESLSSIFRTVPTGIVVVSDRTVETVNDRLCEIFGYAREELVGHGTRKLFVSEEEFQRCGKAIYEQLDDTGVSSVEAHMVRKDGREIHALITTSRLSAKEKEAAVISSMLDITEQKRAQEELRIHHDRLEDKVRERTEELTESNAELQRLIAASENRSEQAATLNEMGELLQACETEEETYFVAVGVCSKLFPHDSGCIGILDENNWNINIVGSWGQGNSCSSEFAHNDCWAIRRGKAHAVLEPGIDPLCGHVREQPECGTLCVPMSAQGKVLGMAHMLIDATVREYKESERRRVMHEKLLLLSGLAERYAPCLVNLRLRESLREQSIRDRLTGLFNRRYMETALTRELARARRRGSPLAVILIDVDHFKRFNDTYGHETGDSVLQELGGYLISQVRTEDVPCRYGGEELLLIMPDCGLKDGRVRAEGIRRGIEQEVMVFHKEARLHVTASLGVATFPLHGEDMEALIASADNALYRAKQGGRNQVVAQEA